MNVADQEFPLPFVAVEATIQCLYGILIMRSPVNAPM